MPPTPGLEIIDLQKRFGDITALDGMTFTVNPGDMYGFVGSNGAGKSTTMRIALGVLSTDSGEVRFRGEKLTDTIRSRIGYMPEERGLYAKEGIADQLIFLARLHGMKKAAASKATNNLLARLGLAERSKDKLEDLSLGNQQRVQLAAALVHDPDLLILDEPFSGLDPVAVSVMSELLTEYTNKGVPVVFSSHQLDLVQRLCNRIGIVAHGHMITEGAVNDLRTRGPVRYEIHTTDADPTEWLPPQISLIEASGGRLLVEFDEDAPADNDQLLLDAARSHGPVHHFSRNIPDLTELFKEVVSQ